MITVSQLFAKLLQRVFKAGYEYKPSDPNMSSQEAWQQWAKENIDVRD